jgi:putative Mg2+ transporter-C (MgtC) family protein
MMVELQILGIVGLAALLGGIVGIDRELADKPAGLRTHMLVAASAALLVSLANVIVPNLDINPDLVQMDPIRMIEAIVAGITFLGAGTIIRQKSGIEGLTTAAALLYVAALGVTVALSQFALAIGLTVLNLVILRGIKLFEKTVLNNYGIQFDSEEKKQPSSDEREQEKIQK